MRDGIQLTEEQLASLEEDDSTENPTGLDFKETDFIVSKDMGPQCTVCTHYEDEHNGPNDHCMHIIATADIAEAKESRKGGFWVPEVNQRCPCKEFQD